jgi:hypothetical protein
MCPQETSFAFRKRVEDYQLERTSVGLEEIPAEELIIVILNRLDMSRYASLVRDYLDIERRGIAALPELPSKRSGKKSKTLRSPDSEERDRLIFRQFTCRE